MMFHYNAVEVFNIFSSFCIMLIHQSLSLFVIKRFRQVGNRSSEFHPEVRRVRREGSYIYEEFMPTGGTDVKVICCLLDLSVISSFSGWTVA